MKMTDRGTVTVPKELRERYGLGPDVEVEFVPDGKGILIKKKAKGKHPVDRVRGVLKGPFDVDAYIEEIRGAMMTAVDTNVLLDIFYDPSENAEGSGEALREAYDRGGLCIASAVYAELSPRFADRALLDSSLQELGIMLIPDDAEVAWRAGRSWASYRSSGGSRERILTDFLVAAHAIVNADALLTRDRGFYRKHVGELVVIDPTEGASDDGT